MILSSQGKVISNPDAHLFSFSQTIYCSKLYNNIVKEYTSMQAAAGRFLYTALAIYFK